MARYCILLLVAALLFLAPLPAAEEQTEALAQGKIPCLAILAKSVEENGGEWATSFHASQTTDLTLGIVFPSSIHGEHEVELRLYTPNGNLYQSLRVPVAAPGASTGANRTVKDYPMAIQQVVLKPVKYLGKPVYTAEVHFPVGGTLISSNSLYGQWRLEALLDAEKQLCGKPAYIQIEE
jgi:hypothetical protein